MFIYNLYLLSFILMLYRAPVDTSPVTEGATLFKHQLLLVLVVSHCLLKKLRELCGGIKSRL